MPTDDDRLETVLERSRAVGFLGPGPVGEHIAHARLFAPPLRGLEATGGSAVLIADLGAGGGVPSLPLAMDEPELSFVLIDAAQRRASFLVWAVVELGIADRVEVWCGRAEDFGHRPERRGAFDAVVARSFAAPATTIECAAPLLRVGGRCIISEPPGRRRWPVEALRSVGLAETTEAGEGVAVFERNETVDDRYPRSAKEQNRSPLFTF